MSTEPPENKSFSEYFQFIIAMIMIISLVVFLAILYYNENFDYAEKLIATFGAFVGVIIGFYFGQKPIQNLTKQVSQATSKTESAKDTVINYTNQVETDQEIITTLKETIKIREELIEDLLGKKGIS